MSSPATRLVPPAGEMDHRGNRVLGRSTDKRRAKAKDHMRQCTRVEWQPGELEAMSDESCRRCWGTGQHPTYAAKVRPCDCVYRRVFRRCLAEYRRIRSRTLESTIGLYRHGSTAGRGGMGWHRPQQSYVCDFELLARRVLTQQEMRLFWARVHRDQTARALAMELGWSVGATNHTTYRVETTLGQVYAETTPYGLWPLESYYGHGESVAFTCDDQPVWPWQVAA